MMSRRKLRFWTLICEPGNGKMENTIAFETAVEGGNWS